MNKLTPNPFPLIVLSVLAISMTGEIKLMALLVVFWIIAITIAVLFLK